jgi:3-deoxy-manno-octulosonate cytidylyltransferase (CMP-KDO synthetase)
VSGTHRVAAVAGREEAAGYDVFLNFQADEPFLPADAAARVLAPVLEGRAAIATLAVPLAGRAEWESPGIVKVVRAADGSALYFSRAPIPHVRDGEPSFDEPDTAFLRHVGLYAYSRSALARWVSLPPSPLEGLERLEQLRALEAGLAIHVATAGAFEPGVDLPEDLERADRRLRETDPNFKETSRSHV